MKFDRNHTGTKAQYIPYNEDTEHENEVRVTVEYHSPTLTKVLAKRAYKSLARSVINPHYSASRCYGRSAKGGYHDPILGVFLPITKELAEAQVRENAPFMRLLIKACNEVSSFGQEIMEADGSHAYDHEDAYDHVKALDYNRSAKINIRLGEENQDYVDFLWRHHDGYQELVEHTLTQPFRASYNTYVVYEQNDPSEELNILPLYLGKSHHVQKALDACRMYEDEPDELVLIRILYEYLDIQQPTKTYDPEVPLK